MIRLDKKTQQDFLNREWVEKLLDIGVNMSDSKYYIYTNPIDKKDYIGYKEQIDKDYALNCVPTYTVSELLYKLHEYIYPKINEKEYSGGLRFIKDAPFYIWYYDLVVKNENKEDRVDNKDDYIYAEAEYPIESLASLLIQCYKKDIGMNIKDTGDISNK